MQTMFEKTRVLIKDLLPPILLKFRRNRLQKYGYFGNYSSWDQAESASAGYAAEIILTRVREAMLKVKSGTAAYQRDSVIFDQIHYSWPVLAGLLRAAALNQNKLNLIDFGGSLGSHYYQCQPFLKGLDELQWNVVEQENFVRCGQELFANQQLKFYFDIDSCLQETQPNLILLSGVIQCLPQPYVFLTQLLNYNFKHIIFDRVPFNSAPGDRLTVQRVPPEIYDASYPVWFLDYPRFLDILASGNYQLITEFDGFDQANIPGKFKGFIYELATK